MANAILVTDDDVIICDPEGEYGNLVKQFKGEVIKVSAKSKDYLNPLDINMNYGDGDAPLKDKANFIISMLELVVGGTGLTAEEKSIVDRCLPKIYENYFNEPKAENMPILQDLYDMLKTQEEHVGRKLATEMEIYVTGSLNVFNHQSNVDLNKQLLCFDIKELGTQLKKIGMLVIQDQVWNKVSLNRGSKATRYYIDEFHLLLKDEQTAQYSVEIWKRFRKWGGIPTGITQNVKDLLMSKEIENIFEDICCKGWMSNPLLKQRRLAHSQRFEPATQRGRDRQAAWSERYVHPYISSSKIELAAALTRKDVSPLPPTTPVGGARTA